MVFVDYINRYLGWRNWAVLAYNSVFENMFVLFYIALRKQDYSADFLISFLIFLFFSMFCTSYGYLVNDLSDKELDEVHGKANTFKGDSQRKAVGIVLVFLFLSLVCGLKFIGSRYFLWTWGVWLLIATEYSLGPVRLKERGKFGLITVVIAQRLLPALLIFFAFSYYDIADVILISVYIFFRGFSSDISHQIQDYYKDKTTGTTTCAVNVGMEKIESLFRFSLETEKFLLIPVLCVISVKLSNPAVFAGLFFYIALYSFGLLKSWKIKTVSLINPFLPGRKDTFQIIHHAFPTTVFSLLLLVLLIPKNRLYGVVLMAMVIMRGLYNPRLFIEYFSIKKASHG